MPRILLLDLDGVLLQNDVYEEEWRRLAGDAFVPIVGGDPAGWADSHGPWLRVEREANERLRALAPEARPHPSDWWRDVNATWIQEACELAGAEPPATVDARDEVARRALTHFFDHTRSPFPGVANVVRALARDFELHMASGNPAFIVETVLARLGIREHVDHPFGSDLLGAYKWEGARFYERLLASVGATPGEAAVADDLDGPLRTARRVGLMTVGVGPEVRTCDLAIETLAELPDRLARE